MMTEFSGNGVVNSNSNFKMISQTTQVKQQS